jgi:hypothetical protein
LFANVAATFVMVHQGSNPVQFARLWQWGAGTNGGGVPSHFRTGSGVVNLNVLCGGRAVVQVNQKNE